MKAAILALLLAGCASHEIITPAPYAVPVAEHCNPPLITEPKWNVDNLHPGVGIFDGVQAIVADLPLRTGYEAELRAAVDACRGPVPVSDTEPKPGS